MNENRRQVLEMLAAGKITAEEAERLIAALEPDSSAGGGDCGGGPAGNSGAKAGTAKTRPKYLRVQVEANRHGAPATVNVRVPMQLLRAGVRLASLIPAQAHEHLDEALSRHGVPLTVSQIKPENLEELIEHLEDLTLDINAQQDQAKVRVFCE
jgi:hypothetical protein